MKIIRGQLKPFGGSVEYTTGSRKLVSLIQKNPGDVFQFVFLAETNDEKQGLLPNQPVSARNVSRTLDFGPDQFINNEVLSFQEKFGPIIICDLRGRDVAIETPFVAKFNLDGTVEVITQTNESLPREQTVKQWQKLRKMTKGVDIGDRVSDMNKQGANIQYIQNPVDTGIESYEDFEKKNKSFVPSWNLKGMLSPYRKNKIKRFNEGVWNYQRKSDGDLCRQIARDLYYNGHDERGGLYDRQESGEKIKYKELEELFNNPKELHKESTWDMFETVLSELTKSENWDEKVGINFYSEDGDENDEDEIEPGDYVNFNRHGLLYVVSILGDGYLVSKDENQRYEGDNGDGFIIPFDSEGTVIEKGN